MGVICVNKKFIFLTGNIILFYFAFWFISSNQQVLKAERGDIMELELTSSVFKNNQTIPQKYTCEGEDISPPFNWTGVPEDTKSFALIVNDPDAPVGIWVHWVIYNIPSDITELSEGIATNKTLDSGAIQGVNDFRRIGYGGPCPPLGSPHRYFFKLYALDSTLDLSPGANKSQVEEAIQEHILDKTELVGLYSR